jgi:hypothetical protein
MFYTFYNKRTKRTYDMEMKSHELEPYLAKHKNVERVFQPPRMGDSIKLGITRPDSTFQKYVLGRIKDKVPGAKHLEKKYNITKEI